jgi:hypothetical protein
VRRIHRSEVSFVFRKQLFLVSSGDLQAVCTEAGGFSLEWALHIYSVMKNLGKIGREGDGVLGQNWTESPEAAKKGRYGKKKFLSNSRGSERESSKQQSESSNEQPLDQNNTDEVDTDISQAA